MQMKFSGGWTLDDLNDHVTIATDTELADAHKRPFLGVTASAASKTLTLGLDDGDMMILVNEGGTNAFTVKNVEGDTGTSIAKGVVALVIASKTADATVVKTLFTPGT